MSNGGLILVAVAIAIGLVGGLDAYLRASGVSIDDVARLRTALLG